MKKNFFIQNSESLNKLILSLDYKKINNLYFKIKKFKKSKNKILIFGNGAGASIASHFSNDLSNTSHIKAFSFDNSAHLTCFANDYGYENWVKKTLEIYVQKKDFVILISASGNSQNMTNAAKYLNRKKIDFYSLTGFNKKNKLNKLSKNYYWINSHSYNLVEILQLYILLMIVDKLNKY